MTRFFDWMTAHVEPYVSFRFLLAMVFGGMFVHWCIVGWLTASDLLRSAPAMSPREVQAGRIARNYALLIVLRAFSFDFLRRNAWLLAQVLVLLAAAAVLTFQVFEAENPAPAAAPQ